MVVSPKEIENLNSVKKSICVSLRVKRSSPDDSTGLPRRSDVMSKLLAMTFNYWRLYIWFKFRSYAK